MEDSVNSMFFLKETISKFKNEIQKFIIDPKNINNYAINLHNSLEYLEKNISDKENKKTINVINNKWSHINANFKPIGYSYSAIGNLVNSNNNNNIVGSSLGNKISMSDKKKYFSSENFNNGNMSKTDLLQSNGLLSHEITNRGKSNLGYLTNNIYNHTSSLKNEKSNSNELNNTSFDNNINNRDEVPLDIKGISENYYTLKYSTNENLTGNFKEEITDKQKVTNDYTTTSDRDDYLMENTEFFSRKIKKRLNEEKEKNFFKNTMILRRINDEIHDKIVGMENYFKNKNEKLKLIDKYDISRKKLNKIKVKRSVGNMNYMDRKKIQRFAHDKKSFFNSVNYDNYKDPIITPDELERGLLAMINRGVIPKQADLTPAFNRDGNPLTFASGAALMELYGETSVNNIQLANKNLNSVDIRIKDDHKKFFVTEAKDVGQFNRLKNLLSQKNHRMSSEYDNPDGESLQKQNAIRNEIQEDEFDDDNLYDAMEDNVTNKKINILNNSKESIERYTSENVNNKNNPSSPVFNTESNEMNNHSDNIINTMESFEMNRNLNSKRTLNLANDNTNDNEGKESKKILPDPTEYMMINNSNASFTKSYYKTEKYLRNKIATNTNFNLRNTSTTANNTNTNEHNIIVTNREREFLENNADTAVGKFEIFEDEAMESIENKNPDREYLKVQKIYNNTQITMTREKNLFLVFKNFVILDNQDYKAFKADNEDNWGKINYIIKHIQKLFQKLNFVSEEVDARKLLILAQDELRNITNKDLILLMSDRHIKTRGFSNQKILHKNLKEAFIIRIQSFYRRHIAKKFYLVQKHINKQVKRIQRYFRLFKLRKIYYKIIEQKREEKLRTWRIMMDDFKNNWSRIKEGPRIEIHINSYGFDAMKNATFEKFKEKENNQLSRIISLKDSNVEIIYICPFEINPDVLSYYFSILSTLGIGNVKERFHLIVPVTIMYIIVFLLY